MHPRPMYVLVIPSIRSRPPKLESDPWLGSPAAVLSSERISKPEFPGLGRRSLGTEVGIELLIWSGEDESCLFPFPAFQT